MTRCEWCRRAIETSVAAPLQAEVTVSVPNMLGPRGQHAHWWICLQCYVELLKLASNQAIAEVASG